MQAAEGVVSCILSAVAASILDRLYGIIVFTSRRRWLVVGRLKLNTVFANGACRVLFLTVALGH